MAAQNRTAEQVMERLGRPSQGVVDREELLAAGITRHQIARCLKNGVLWPEFEGVYRVGHRAPSVEAHYMAAVKACGKGAVLRGRAAGYLWGLVKAPVPKPEVLTPTERRIKGIKTTRSRRIDRRDVTKRDGIPITTVARTVVDLAADSTPDDLAVYFHAGVTRYKLKPHHVEAVLERQRNAKGATKLRRVMRGDTRALLSELERGFIALLREHNLPLPKTNIRRGEHWVDCRWPEHQLTVELDSYRFHSTRYAWEQDHTRERNARKRGDEYRRYVYSDVFEQPEPTVNELLQLLSSTRKWQRPTPVPDPARRSPPTAARR
jgi:very-short-patch-repair endonuclease